MQNRLAGVAAVGGVVGLMSLGIAQPASAAAGDTITTFSLTGGVLAVVVQPAAALVDLSPDANAGATAVTGSLGVVTVTDLRGGNTPWVASATSTQFTSVSGVGGSAVTSRSTKVEYQSGAITTVGSLTVAAGAKTELTTSPAAVVRPSALVGANTAVWTPTLTVTLPSTALTGLYTGTVNTSVA